MKVLEIKELKRKQTPIYYRRIYTGKAIIEIIAGKNIEAPLTFCVETRPTGFKDITVDFTEGVDYPLVPITHACKRLIETMDEEGGLPL
jgi:hypothetical protein